MPRRASRCAAWTAAPDGKTVFAFGRDITANRQRSDALAKTEALLRQAQKMEAIGKRPGPKVLFVTGYAEQAAVRNRFPSDNMQMINKPFVVDELAQRIRAFLRDEVIRKAR